MDYQTNLSSFYQPISFTDTSTGTSHLVLDWPISLNYSPVTLTFIALLLLLFIIATALGNLMVVFALYRYRNLRTISNYLIGNLAASDLLLALTVLPLSTLNECLGRWVLGRIACHVWLLTDVLYCTASIWNLCIIAFDRFTATCFPVWYREKRSARQAIGYIALVWVISGAICLPALLNWSNLTENYVYDNNTLVYHCIVFQSPSYVIYSANGSFFIPFIFTIVLYFAIFLSLRRRISRIRRSSATSTASSVGHGSLSRIRGPRGSMKTRKGSGMSCGTRRGSTTSWNPLVGGMIGSRRCSGVSTKTGDSDGQVTLAGVIIAVTAEDDEENVSRDLEEGNEGGNEGGNENEEKYNTENEVKCKENKTCCHGENYRNLEKIPDNLTSKCEASTDGPQCCVGESQRTTNSAKILDSLETCDINNDNLVTSCTKNNEDSVCADCGATAAENLDKLKPEWELNLLEEKTIVRNDNDCSVLTTNSLSVTTSNNSILSIPCHIPSEIKDIDSPVGQGAVTPLSSDQGSISGSNIESTFCFVTNTVSTEPIETFPSDVSNNETSETQSIQVKIPITSTNFNTISISSVDYETNEKSLIEFEVPPRDAKSSEHSVIKSRSADLLGFKNDEILSPSSEKLDQKGSACIVNNHCRDSMIKNCPASTLEDRHTCSLSSMKTQITEINRCDNVTSSEFCGGHSKSSVITLTPPSLCAENQVNCQNCHIDDSKDVTDDTCVTGSTGDTSDRCNIVSNINTEIISDSIKTGNLNSFGAHKPVNSVQKESVVLRDQIYVIAVTNQNSITADNHQYEANSNSANDSQIKTNHSAITANNSTASINHLIDSNRLIFDKTDQDSVQDRNITITTSSDNLINLEDVDKSSAVNTSASNLENIDNKASVKNNLSLVLVKEDEKSIIKDSKTLKEHNPPVQVDAPLVIANKQLFQLNPALTQSVVMSETHTPSGSIRNISSSGTPNNEAQTPTPFVFRSSLRRTGRNVKNRISFKLHDDHSQCDKGMSRENFGNRIYTRTRSEINIFSNRNISQNSSENTTPRNFRQKFPENSRRTLAAKILRNSDNVCQDVKTSDSHVQGERSVLEGDPDGRKVGEGVEVEEMEEGEAERTLLLGDTDQSPLPLSTPPGKDRRNSTFYSLASTDDILVKPSKAMNGLEPPSTRGKYGGGILKRWSDRSTRSDCSRGRISLGRSAQRYEQREMRATIRMAVIILVFSLMWIGFFIVYTLRGCCPSPHCPSIPAQLEVFFFWLGYSNSCVNPILYTVFNEDFRRAFSKMLNSWCGCCSCCAKLLGKDGVVGGMHSSWFGAGTGAGASQTTKRKSSNDATSAIITTTACIVNDAPTTVPVGPTLTVASAGKR